MRRVGLGQIQPCGPSAPQMTIAGQTITGTCSPGFTCVTGVTGPNATNPGQPIGTCTANPVPAQNCPSGQIFSQFNAMLPYPTPGCIPASTIAGMAEGGIAPVATAPTTVTASLPVTGTTTTTGPSVTEIALIAGAFLVIAAAGGAFH